MINTVDLMQAVQLLKQGEVVAYPTEAVWGLGCDPYNQSAFEKILILKNRPIEKGVILIASSMQQAEPFLSALTPDQCHRILQTWQSSKQQQATTWLVPLTPAVPAWISGQYQQVAIRITHHPLCQKLCQQFGGAIVSTSANPAGLSPALDAAQIADYFPDIAILQGELGHCRAPSRIIDSQTGQIIRA